MPEENSQLYGPGSKEHHFWCNYWMTVGPCKFCDRYYRMYPYPEGDPSKLNTYFPDVIVRTNQGDQTC